MARRLLTLASALSLLLCVATCVLWAASWQRPWAVTGEAVAGPPGAVLKGSPQPERAVWLMSARGVLEARWLSRGGPPPTPVGPWEWSASTVAAPSTLADRLPSPWNRLGFAWVDGVPGGSYFYPSGGRAARARTADVPYWALALVTAGLPTRWALRRHAAGRRRRHGRCPACGYDLRATPGRCPECGAEPPPSSASRGTGP